MITAKLFRELLFFANVTHLLSHLVIGIGLSFVQLSEETHWCMLRSGKHYQPEMSEVVELLKAWKEEREEDKRRYEQYLQYDINVEMYRRRFHAIKPLENEMLVELVIRVKKPGREMAGKLSK